MNRRFASAAVAAGVVLLSATVGTPAGSARPSAVRHPAFGTIAVANFGNNELLKFAAGASGNVAPVVDIIGAATGLDGPSGLGFDRHGKLYTANYNIASVTAYAPGATGNAAPTLTITGANTTLDHPIGLAVTPAGDIWVANFGTSSILEFAAGSVGNAPPTRTIAGALTGLTSVIGLALTVDGKGVWVTDEVGLGAAVEREFSTHANGDVAPIATIAGGQTQLDQPYGVAVALDGSVVFDQHSSPAAVLSFGPHARGNAAPRSVISGSNTGMSEPTFIGLNPAGKIWVPNFNGNSVTRYPSNASGNAAPDHQIVGAATLLNHPEAASVYMRPPNAPRSVKKHVHGKTLKLSWHRPHVNGGGIEGYQVRRAKHKAGKYHVVKTTTKRSYKKHHAKHGFYDVVAFNQGGYGKHSKRVHVT